MDRASTTPSHERHDLDRVARAQPGLAIGLAGHHVQIALDRHTGRVQSKNCKELRHRAALGQPAALSIDRHLNLGHRGSFIPRGVRPDKPVSLASRLWLAFDTDSEFLATLEE